MRRDDNMSASEFTTQGRKGSEEGKLAGCCGGDLTI